MFRQSDGIGGSCFGAGFGGGVVVDNPDTFFDLHKPLTRASALHRATVARSGVDVVDVSPLHSPTQERYSAQNPW